ncbi:hypothetical protein BHE74_00004525 [Ensete ventricosum]|nr:hypothetical protein BHE74_00004525 [Ensete ventricosum]RZR83758.1 hypothetical protein BHM03_00010454 [Ensete ventricosum]
MMRLKDAEGENPLMPRWSAIVGSSQFWTKGPLSGEYLRGALHPTLAKQEYKYSYEELLNRASKLVVWVPGDARAATGEISGDRGGANPFVEYPEDANVKMDLSQPFDHSSPSEK